MTSDQFVSWLRGTIAMREAQNAGKKIALPIRFNEAEVKLIRQQLDAVKLSDNPVQST